MQLDKLWQFMQSDMEADRFENGIRQSEKRQKLLKQRNFLMDQQNNMKKIEGDVVAMSDRLEAVSDEAQRLQKTLDALLEEIENNPPKSAEEADARIEPVQKLMDKLSRYEQELSKMRKDADTKDRQQRDIRVRAAKTKQEFDLLKKDYDVEFKRDTAELKAMRDKTDAEAAKLDPALLEKYRSVKRHVTPPMAKLIDGQCSGCFISLPGATMLEIKNGENMVVCDNCGRILFNAE